MKNIDRFLSERKSKDWPSWDIVKEWENELSELLNLRIGDIGIFKADKIPYTVKKIDRRYLKNNFLSVLQDFVFRTESPFFCFEMHPEIYYSDYNSNKSHPLIIDFWIKDNIELFKKFYRKCPYIFISSLEALKFVRQLGMLEKAIHFPISLPSKYQLSKNSKFKKIYDIIIPGRPNKILESYINQYADENPEIEYLYPVHVDNEIYYKSNKKGVLGKFQSREAYIKLLQSAKIGFYSTPGIDGGEERTNGFNPVTPRFLELMSAGCHIIARYPKNPDTEFFQLQEICPSIENYQDFCKQLNKALTSDVNLEFYSQYLKQHYTKERSKILIEYL